MSKRFVVIVEESLTTEMYIYFIFDTIERKQLTTSYYDYDLAYADCEIMNKGEEISK